MFEIRKTEVYARWLDGWTACGIPAPVRGYWCGAVGEGVSELRIDYGPGYRVYYKRQGRAIVVLLAGGDKRTQSRDIETALRLAKNL